MAVASGGIKSTLNPNAPLFIPAALRQVEDFSPEWWDLVKTNTWFREYWFHEHQEQETFDGDDEDEDVANLLPESFDLGITEDFANFEQQFEEVAHPQTEGADFTVLKKDTLRSGLESEAEKLMKNLSLKSPKNGKVRAIVEPTKCRENLSLKSPKMVSPRSGGSRRIIQQPR